jgi:iron complex outermembrane receptor protein
VIGSRVAGRSAQDSPVPVDVIQGEDLQTYGIRDMDSLLSASVPSYNVGQEPISDEATFVRPATLRGLPPDSTLVLVNGKRRHRGSVINFLGSPNSRGSQGADISTIPAIALERVEVLRDGAAAQYGSDAIAGVLNFVLKENREGLTVHTNWGQNYHGDGDKVQVAANLGLPLTENGFANFSFEFMNVDETSRSVQRSDARGLIEAGNERVRRPAAQIWGAPEVQYDYKFFGNVGLDLEEINSRLYAFGNYAERRVEGGFYFRNPHTRNGVFKGDPLEDGTPTVKMIDLSHDGLSGNCRDIPIRGNVPQFAEVADNGPDCFSFIERFPGGFTPRFGGYVKDWSIAFGLTGDLEGFGGIYSLLNGWFYDASASFGHNSVDFFMRNTINPQLAAMRTNIPTSYKPGGYREFDKVFNLDISRPFDVGIFFSPLNFAFGLEHREEEFEIRTGGQNSWYVDNSPGGLAAQGFGIGSNGFQGFGPDIAGTFSRGSYAGYLDLEAEVVESLSLGIAGRYETYEGIADTLDGKVSARWQFLTDWAVRGSVSSGFRAPTVGQANYRKTSTSLEGSRLVDNAILPPDHPAAVLKGSKKLEPEKSINYSVGTVFSLGDLAVTIDYYRIKVQGRMALTSNLKLTQTDIDTLLAQGVSDARSFSGVNFFTNDFDTTTQGVDVVATYPLHTVAGHTLMTFVGNWTDTQVDSFNPNVINARRRRQYEDALPEFRFSLSADHSWGPWRLLTRVHYYDGFFEDIVEAGLTSINGERWLTDMELSYTVRDLPFMRVATLAFGAENMFDQYPRKSRWAGVLGNKYPPNSPYGFNGGFYYVRASFEF